MDRTSLLSFHQKLEDRSTTFTLQEDQNSLNKLRLFSGRVSMGENRLDERIKVSHHRWEERFEP